MEKYSYFRVTNWLKSMEDCIFWYNFLKNKGIVCWIGYDKKHSTPEETKPYAVWREGAEGVSTRNLRNNELFVGEKIQCVN